MGCCVSTNRGTSSSLTPTKKQDSPVAPQYSKPRPSLQPLPKSPPPSLEVETVKEVLSEEAHKPKPKPTKYPHLEPLLHEACSTKLYHIGNQTPKHVIEKEETSNCGVQEESVDDIVSEQGKSEISSSTITNDFSYEEERETKAPMRRRPKSSQSATSKLTIPTRAGSNYDPGRRAVVGKSPTRRVVDQSPVRRRANAPPGSGQVVVRRGLRYDDHDPSRKDPPGGGSSRRRSRSPATNRSEMGRSPSSGSGRKVKSPPGGLRTEEMGRVNSNTIWANGEASGGDKYNSNESLENPLVSLECFIFL